MTSVSGDRPAGRAVGLTKLTRCVRWQSRRLTIQEQLTDDLAIGLADELETDVVLVEVTATHLCEAMRGVETASKTTHATEGEPTKTARGWFQQAVGNEGDEG